MTARPRIFPLGDDAITVDYGSEISESLNRSAIGLAEYVMSNPFPGFVEAVPAYSSVTFFYRVADVFAKTSNATTAFEVVQTKLLEALTVAQHLVQTPARQVTIPVRFGPDESIDLDAVAKIGGLWPEEVVSIFLAGEYRVFMLGFLPGFAYMGTVDERIAVPRHSEPRLKVPRGSVGIAGQQTGVYPSESPGGWQIVGRTDLDLLTGDPDSPCALRPGDEVKFVRAPAG